MRASRESCVRSISHVRGLCVFVLAPQTGPIFVVASRAPDRMSDLQYSSLHGPLHPSLDPGSKAWKVGGKSTAVPSPTLLSWRSPRQSPRAHKTDAGVSEDVMTAQPRQRFPISERRERPQEPQTLGLTERRAFNA